MATPNDLLRTYLTQIRHALAGGDTASALKIVQQAEALIAPPAEPPPFDPTKPRKFVGKMFGVEQFANDDIIDE